MYNHLINLNWETMKKIIFTILITYISLQALTIEARKSKTDLSKITPISREWMTAKVSELILYPETNSTAKAKKAGVRVLYNEKNIAFLIEWHDKTKSVQKELNGTNYADGFTIQFASNLEIGKLPYIKMGSKDREVLVHKQRFYKSKNKKTFIAEGSKSIKNIEINSTSSMEHLGKNWRGTLIRPIKDNYINLSSDAIAVSFVIWHSENDNEGLKLLSSWVGVSKDAKEDNALLATLNAKAEGDIKRGKELAKKYCASCHNYKTTPNLTNIGGYASTVYLIESIVKPNAVVADGKNISSMPSFNYLPTKDILDIVTFFQTLKETSKD